MLYFDESGNSGDNLLDEGQPTFVLLSHDFTEDEAKSILAPLLQQSKANELHFKTIKKYSSQRKALIECFNNSLIKPERIYFYAAHKQFMVVIQMVDKLVETVLYYNNIDIYKEGLNISTANILYVMGINGWDKTLFQAMCSSFVKWVRYPNPEHRRIFYDAATVLGKTLKTTEDRDLLSLIQHSEKYADRIEKSFNTYSLDATLSCFVAHCDHWAKLYKCPFDVTVDDSKQMEYWDEMIRFLTEELPTAEVGYGSRKHKYPLLINSIKRGASKECLPIQLADLLASSLNQYFVSLVRGTNDDFTQMLLSTPIKEIIGNKMWPTTAVTPEDLDMTDTTGQNPLDFLAGIAKEKSEAFAKANRRKEK